MKLLTSATIQDLSLQELRDQVIVNGAEVPDLVLASGLRDYAWMEFEDVLQRAFWDLLTRCASEFGDRRIYVQCDDEHILDTVGHPAVAEFDVADPSSAYSEFLDLYNPHVRPVESLRYYADRLLFWGDSARWAFVGSRSVELCVGGHESDSGWPLVKTIRFHTFETVLDLASGPYRKQLPADQLAKYEAIYRAKSWPITSYQEGA